MFESLKSPEGEGDNIELDDEVNKRTQETSK